MTQGQFAPISENLNKMRGLELSRVVLWPFSVDFVFLDSIEITVGINSKFTFLLDDKEFSYFDPCEGYGEDQDPKFIFLKGRKCIAVDFANNLLQILLTSNGIIRIELSPGVRETVHLIGGSGPPNDRVLFYHVL